jgi:tyrosinase
MEHGKEGPNVLRDWTVRIHFKKYELGGSFAVLIFLGQVPEDPSQWRTAPTFVGSHHAFVNSVASRWDNGRDQEDIVNEGFVHLNSAIAERSGLSSFDPSVVIPYLKENLHWRVQAVRVILLYPAADLAITYAFSTKLQGDRTAVDISKLPSLEVTVVSTPLTHAPGSIFPIPGDAQYHNEITYGRPGGARRAQA